MICQKEFTIQMKDSLMYGLTWIEPLDGTNDQLPITAEGGIVPETSWAFNVSGSARDRLIWMVHVTNSTGINYDLNFHMEVSGEIFALNGASPSVSTLVRYGNAGPPVSVPTAGTVIPNLAGLGSTVGPYSRIADGVYTLNNGLDIWFALQWDPFRVNGNITGHMTVLSTPA